MTVQFVPSDYVEQAMAQAVYDDNAMLKPAEASLRQGWLEAMTGQTRPISELWEGIDLNKEPSREPVGTL